MKLRFIGILLFSLVLNVVAQNLKLPNGLVAVKETVNKLGSGHDGWVFQIVLRSAPTLCLDLSGGSSSNGTPIDVWECNGMEGQLWFFDAGTYQITAGSDSSKCLDAGSLQAGNQLFLWDCNGSDQQTWGYDGDAGTIYLAASSDASLCVDIAGGDTSGGTAVQVWDCNDEWNQAWDIVSGVTIRVVSDYTKCLDLSGADSSNGSPIQIWGCNGMPGQFWNFEGDAWEIRWAADTSKCIDAGDMQAGTGLFIWDCNGYDSQKFGYDANAGTLYLASSADASSCVDISGGSLDDGTRVEVWDCDFCWNQMFSVVGPVGSVQSPQLGRPFPIGSLRGSSSNHKLALADCPPLGPSPPSPPPSPPAPCDCSWAPAGCGWDDGSFCYSYCCGPSPPPSPPPTPTPTGPSGTASTTRYWDCSEPTCAWANKCPGAGHQPYASDWNQLFKGSDGRIYGTVASSGSFGMDDAGGACMKCYDLVVKDGPAAGKELTVMATNYCPDQPTCPAAGQTNQHGQRYHFDIAIPGGGLGLQGKCSQEYGGGDWKVNSAADCGKLPGGIQSGCELWYNDLNGMDNPLVDWTEVACPSELTSRC